MNKYLEILKAIDIAYMTGNDTLEIPTYFFENDTALEEALNLKSGSALGYRSGQVGPFKVKTTPLVRTSRSINYEADHRG